MRTRFGTSVTVVAVACALWPRIGVGQRCPNGTEYAYTEDLGEEKIVHCRKPHKGVEGALEALRDSELGTRILDFLAANKIPVRVDPSRRWAPDSGAAFEWTSRVVLLPPEAADREPTSLAISIAHEGYHAIQLGDRKMVPCIEAEQDAAFAQFVAYYEMVKRGRRKLAKDDPLARDFRVFAAGVALGKLDTLEEVVREAYLKRRSAIFRMGNFLPRLGRFLIGASIRLCDVVWDLTEDFETLEQRKMHPAHLWDTGPVRRTEQEHKKDQERNKEWIKTHQREFLRGF